MKRQRRKHTPEFKARIALEAIKGIKTISQIAKEFQVHPVMVSTWKKDMLEHLPEVFDKKNTRKDKQIEQETEQLERKVGQLTMEVEFLEKKCRQLGINGKERS